MTPATNGSSATDAPGSADPSERRLVNCLRDYWDSRRRGRAFPALHDIESESIADLWPWCFVLDSKVEFHAPVFQYLGDEIATFAGKFLAGGRDFISSNSLLDLAVENAHDVIKFRAPVVLSDEFDLRNGRRILFRVATLPLSEDQKRIDFILGGANGKIVEP
jgi:hypothetical protein